MFKIAKIAPLPFFIDRGSPVRIYNEIKALMDQGNKVTCFTYHVGRDLKDVNIVRIPNIPWYQDQYIGGTYHRLYLDLLLLLKFILIFHKSKFDIIHAHTQEGFLIGYMSRLFKKTPIVVDIQSSLIEDMIDQGMIKKDSILYKVFAYFEKIVINKADAIIVPAANLARYIKEKFNLNKEKIFVVGDNVNTELFRPDCNNTDLRNKLNLANKKVVVYLGLLAKNQGIDLLLKSIPLVTRRMDNVHFVIMGYPNVDKYKKMAEGIGILNKVTFTGKINYFVSPKYLALGDIAVSPKDPGSQSNGKLWNYMAMGLPTVVYEHPVNREILGDLGIYVKMGDYVAFADAIIKTLSNNQLTNTLGIQLRERAIKEQSHKKTGEKLMEVYEWVTK